MHKTVLLSAIAVATLSIFAACGNDWIYPQSGDAGTVDSVFDGGSVVDSGNTTVLVDSGTSVVDAGSSDAGCPLNNNDNDDRDHEDKYHDRNCKRKIVCHVPQSPRKCHNIYVNDDDATKHLNHGDYLGHCH